MRVRCGTESTNAERIIWRVVRAHRLNGVGFRRQTPIGPYIADFVSQAAKIVIELDGGQHYENLHEAQDARRDNFLRSKGFRVLRFSNYDVMTNLEGVWDIIATAVGAAAAPSLPSHAIGEGEPSGPGGGRNAMMKFTLAWLKEHLDTDRSLGEIADKLTMIGLEVERIEDKAKRSRRSSSRAWPTPSGIPMPTGSRCAWSMPARAIRSRSFAARRMHAPA